MSGLHGFLAQLLNPQGQQNRLGLAGQLNGSQSFTEEPSSPTPTASAMDVWRGQAAEGIATNGDTLRRLPNGMVERTSSRYGYTEIMQPGSPGGPAHQGQITRAGGYPAGMMPASQGAQPRGPSGDSGSGGGFLSGLADWLDGGQSRAINKTVDWLVNVKGYEPSAASYIVQDREFMQEILRDHIRGGDPTDALQDQKLRLEIERLRNPQPSFGDQVAAARLEFDRSNAELTTDIREYQRAKKEGYQGQLRDWILETKRAGATSINNNVTGERGYDKTVGEGYGKRFLDIQAGAQTAQRALNALDVMEQTMSDPGFYSGAASGTLQTLKRYGSALGLDAAGIDSMETFNAMTKQAALDVMGGSLGTGFSNADRDFVIDQVPNLQNTPDGNRKLIGVQRLLNRRKQEIAEQARQYAERNGGRIDAGFDEYLAKWAEQNPLFPQRPTGSGRGAGTDTGRTRARNPQTGEVLEWDGSQWRPAR